MYSYPSLKKNKNKKKCRLFRSWASYIPLTLTLL